MKPILFEGKHSEESLCLLVIWRVWIWYCMQIKFKNTYKPTRIPALRCLPMTTASANGNPAPLEAMRTSITAGLEPNVKTAAESANKKSSLFDFLHLVHFWLKLRSLHFFNQKPVKEKVRHGTLCSIPWTKGIHLGNLTHTKKKF